MVDYAPRTRRPMPARRRDDQAHVAPPRRHRFDDDRVRSTTAPLGDLILQAALTVGPAGDRFEREADAVAERVVRSLRSGDGDGGATDERAATGIQRVQRASAVGVDGGSLDHDTSSRLSAARGGGTTMPRPMRRQMEGAFGADFGNIRLHEGSTSTELNERIQAKAFTVGNDIFFRDRIPDTSQRDGQRLVAHELTHTIQQGAAPRRTMQRKTADGARFDDAVPPVVAQHRGSGVVQAKFSLKKTMKSLFGRADRGDVEQTEIDSPVLDGATAEEQDVYARQTKGSGPGENPDYADTKLWGSTPDGYRITLAVAQDRPDWMTDVEALRKAALSNKSMLLKALKGAKVEVPDPSGTGKMSKNPKDVITSIAYESREAQRAKQGEAKRTLEQFEDGIHDVGHTWVRLDKLVKGKVKERYSYGMWPQKIYDPEDSKNYGGYAGFIDAGPGEIRHPDTAHEGDSLTAFQDYSVKKRSFDKALGLAAKRYESPPPYVLTGYNCTAFAREIVQAGGGSYPGKGLLPGFGYTPGNLYAMILKRTSKNRRGARTDSADDDATITARVDARHKAWKKAGKNAADKRHHDLTGRQAARTARKAGPAGPVTPDVTITVWNGTFDAPTETTEPHSVRAWIGPRMFTPTGNSGNGFIEVTDQNSDFFWIRQDEYLAGGTRDTATQPTAPPTVEAVDEAVPFETILEKIRKESLGGMGSDMLAQIIDGGHYGFTSDDIRAALATDTAARARALAELIDETSDTYLVLSWWGRG